MNKGCAIVTGASRGIGAETALELSKLGYEIIVNYNRSEEQAHHVLDNIIKCGGGGYLFKCDVSNRTEVDSMIAFALKTYNKIDVLVNNAGIAQQKLFTDITSDDWSKMININLGGVFNCRQ